MAISMLGMAPLLQVFDMPRSIAFYRDVLEFEVVTTSREGPEFDWALLRRNGVELMLNTAYETGSRPDEPDPARAAAHGDTSLFFGCADVEEAWRHLRGHGLAVAEPVVQGYGMKQLYVTDPDGYVLCFQCPASEKTREQWREWYGREERR